MNLADIYSYIDGKKRALGGLLAEPGLTIDKYVQQVREDSRDRLNLQANAYPMAGDKTVLNSPHQLDQFRKQLADEGANMALAAATVWHGSPHKFDKFDSSKIGTGEGAQAYGHGLYLADVPTVAQSYIPTNEAGKTALANQLATETKKAARYSNEGAQEVFEMFNKGYTPQAIRSNIDNIIADGSVHPSYTKKMNQAYDKGMSIYQQNQGGSLYKVDLPDEHIAKMLDYDAPLSGQLRLLSALGVKQPANLKGAPQGISGASDLIGNGLVGKAGISQGDSFANVDAGGQVLPSVLRAGKNNKVVDPVVGLDAVDMVNLLPRNQLASDVAFNNKSMLLNGLPVNANNDIASAVKVGGVNGVHIPSIAELGQDATGKDLHRILGDVARSYDGNALNQMFRKNGGNQDAAISEFLRQQGIPGIRYLDGGSRGAGTGSQNYVIFPGNEGLLSILERNGQPLE